MTKKHVRKGSDREAIYYCVKKQNSIDNLSGWSQHFSVIF